MRLNDKVVELTKLGKNVCCHTSCELQFVNIFASHKVAVLCSLDVLYYVCQTVLLKVFRRHVGQT